ncbi:DUF421 domain-containing protein [Sphingomicrobium arenosum]|uniref:DUF421 domain-containing protein n=1 Tax=Sphingomicrobium arenosum TaxID=2233861 RepID=UPI002240201A|nr:YetF domain-containing protein [Sphingomicrobium arenosum]
MPTELSFWLPSDGSLIGVFLGACILYFYTVILVRLLGKRATAKMNNFDWLIAVATGSLLASGILVPDISLASAIVAMATLGVCQFAVTKFFAMTDVADDAFKAEPRLLLHKGVWLDDAMVASRISRQEVLSRLRGEGVTSVNDVNWVVIEPDGQLSVITRSDMEIEDADVMSGVVYDRKSLKHREPWPEQ